MFVTLAIFFTYVITRSGLFGQPEVEYLLKTAESAYLTIECINNITTYVLNKNNSTELQSRKEELISNTLKHLNV